LNELNVESCSTVLILYANFFYPLDNFLFGTVFYTYIFCPRCFSQCNELKRTASDRGPIKIN